jgi:8-oxo-dGTP pyrophosphatase MutT (NUDIX family)
MNHLHIASLTIADIRRVLNRPLPGVMGQRKMAPQPRPGQATRWDQPDNCREAGVLLLLYWQTAGDGEASSLPALYLALIRRNEYPGVHSGQISLPGGRREGNESLPATALRETQEEIGVLPETLEIIGQLSPLYTPPSNFCIYPFVAFSGAAPVFQLDPKEVAGLIEVPLTLLLDPAICKEETWYFQGEGDRLIPFFDIFGHQVWGATAMILSEFLTLLCQ